MKACERAQDQSFDHSPPQGTVCKVAFQSQLLDCAKQQLLLAIAALIDGHNGFHISGPHFLLTSEQQFGGSNRRRQLTHHMHHSKRSICPH